MGRPAKWNSRETAAIRIPAHAVDQCLALAKLLDKPADPSFVQNLNPTLVTVNEEQYIIQPEPLSVQELEQVDRMADQLLAGLAAAGLPQHEGLSYCLAELTKQWGRKIG